MVTMVTMTNLNIFHPTCTTTHPKNFPTKFRYNRTNNFFLTFMVTMSTTAIFTCCRKHNNYTNNNNNNNSNNNNNNKRSKNNEHPNCAWESQLTLPHVRNLICKLYQVVNLWRLPINAVLACKYIGQSK